MNKCVRLTLALILSQAFTTAVLAVPIEKGAKIDDSVKGNKPLLENMAKLIRLSGYTCDSLTAVIPFPLSRGFYVTCNQYSYSYELADKGGTWVATLD